MDPDVTLQEIRDEVASLLPGEDRAARLAEQFEALDEWLTSGGALPRAWETDSRPRRAASPPENTRRLGRMLYGDAL